MCLSGFAHDALSTRNAKPEKASRPSMRNVTVLFSPKAPGSSSSRNTNTPNPTARNHGGRIEAAHRRYRDSASALALLTPTQLQVSIITGLTAYTYPVQVVNSNGGASSVVNFQVKAPPVPAITSLTPNPLTHSATAQVLTVNGSNFQSGTGLKVTVGGTSYSGSQVTVVSSSQLKVNVTVSSAASATLAVQVTDPSGAVSNVAPLGVK